MIENRMKASGAYEILFEPVQIGPVTAKNRFYQVPHCTGLGWLRPNMVNALRSVKAEGGWGVVCTEYCSIHPSSDDLPYPYHAIWDQHDIKAHAQMTQSVHHHGALAGVELWAGGGRTSNLFSREVPLGVASQPNMIGHPWQSRKMDKSDIRSLRHWHKQAAKRAREAEFDIVYVYATHDYLLSHFLSPVTNTRTDEYGGSTENRLRLVRELIDETKEAVGDRCAVAVRFSIDDGGGPDGVPAHDELKDMFATIAELPDLWDINIADYSYEMGTSRFVKEASLEPYMKFVKSLTSKPVVSVGRFTSPETMVSQVRHGIMDFIGAARPSIADPFIPHKIQTGQLDDIRECIGCNICYAADAMAVPIRCTQNPTVGEEWRRGWHPEHVAVKGSEAKILIVGAGPAGLEACRVLGGRGYPVILAEAQRELGGRVTKESRLPGLSEWARVRDYRLLQINKMNTVEVYRESTLGVKDILQVNADHVVLATGAVWRDDGVGRTHRRALNCLQPKERIFTPDDILAGVYPNGQIVVYDEDDYYMASLIAQSLAKEQNHVIYVTPQSKVSAWSEHTVEQHRIQSQLLELGVDIVTAHSLSAFDGGRVKLSCIYSETEKVLDADSLVLITARVPNDSLYYDLLQLQHENQDVRFSVSKIGDCDAPSIIADAVFAGHRWARELDATVDSDNPIKYDRGVLMPDQNSIESTRIKHKSNAE